MPDLELPPFTSGLLIVDPKTGRPSHAFHQYWQRVLGQVKEAFDGLSDTVAAVAAAQAAADAADAAAEAANTAAENAQTAADDVTAASYLADSYVANFTPPVVEADSTGNVTVANHDRVYGDGTTVAITGDTIATGEANPAIVYIFYDDATRADTTPTFAFSTNPDDQAQIGDRHSVGAVTIPAAGTASGGYARPPGFSGIQP